MSRLAEILAFSGLAVGAHLALWVWVGGDGADSAGSGGDATVTLAAASGEVSDLIAAWSAPPEVLDTAIEALPQSAEPDRTPDPTWEMASVPRVTLPAPPEAAVSDTSPSLPEQTNAPAFLPAPQTIAQPVLPKAASELAPSLPDPSDSFAKPTAPMQTLPAAPAPSVLPQIDMTSADPAPMGPAPRTSLRPVQRPADLAKPSPPIRQSVVQQTPKTKTQKTQSAKSTAQKAAGTAQGANAGSQQDTAPASLSKATRQSLISKWGASIRNGVERRKSYPAGTRASGKAVVRLTVAPHGRLLGATLAKSSGDSKLDRAALEAVRRARIPKAPKGLTESSYSFNLPIAFTKR